MRWFCLPLLCLPLLASAQDTPADSTETVHLAIVEEVPRWPGCEDVSGTAAQACTDEGVMRHVETFPRFSPGLQRGKPVRVSYSLPMNFALN